MYLFKRISGVRGQITIPDLGVVLGKMESWELRPRRGADNGDNRYDLHAVFSYLNDLMLVDPDYVKEIQVILGRNKEFRAQMTGAEETVLTGRALLVKGVQIREHQAGN